MKPNLQCVYILYGRGVMTIPSAFWHIMACLLGTILDRDPSLYFLCGIGWDTGQKRRARWQPWLVFPRALSTVRPLLRDVSSLGPCGGPASGGCLNVAPAEHNSDRPRVDIGPLLEIASRYRFDFGMNICSQGSFIDTIYIVHRIA